MHCDSEEAAFIIATVVEDRSVKSLENSTVAVCSEACAKMYVRETSTHFLRRQIKRSEETMKAWPSMKELESKKEALAQKFLRVQKVSLNAYKCLLRRDHAMYALYKTKAKDLWVELLPCCVNDGMTQGVAESMKCWFENCEMLEESFF